MMEKVVLGGVTVGAAVCVFSFNRFQIATSQILTVYIQIVVGVVHYQQQRDKKEMRKGVERDIERIAAKKAAKLAEEKASH